jgi:hypothetical protein
MYGSTTLSALATLGAHSPLMAPVTAGRMVLVDGIQVYKVEAVSQSKSSNVWIYDTVTVYTCYTWSPLTCSFRRGKLVWLWLW